MSAKTTNPTPFLDINAILQELLASVKRVLGSHLVGMYLEGSLANGGFDQASDIDFVAVTDIDISGDYFSTLQTMHDRFATLDSPWAIQLEGSYVSRSALRRFDPAHALYPNIERGEGERLKMTYHDEAWMVHRYLLRERGITLFGPDPKTLVDPASPDDLRRAMLPTLHGWAAGILKHPEEINVRWPPSYIILTLCRILYTLERGDVAAKPQAAEWAKEALDERWVGLINRAWKERAGERITADPNEVDQTLDFIHYALARGQCLTSAG